MPPHLLVTFPENTRAFLDKGHTINSSMTTSECFKDITGDLKDHVTRLTPLLEKLEGSANNAKSRATEAITYRREVQKEVKAHLVAMAKLIEVFAAGDLKILESSGYGIAKTSSRKIKYPLVVVYLALTHGENTGEMDGRGKTVPGAWSYEVHFTDGDPSVEANWRPYGTYRACGHLKFTGLTAGTKYSFRIRGIWDDGPGPWSPPTTLMSL
jgi:hypothetical protein